MASLTQPGGAVLAVRLVLALALGILAYLSYTPIAQGVPGAAYAAAAASAAACLLGWEAAAVVVAALGAATAAYEGYVAAAYAAAMAAVAASIAAQRSRALRGRRLSTRACLPGCRTATLASTAAALLAALLAAYAAYTLSLALFSLPTLELGPLGGVVVWASQSMVLRVVGAVAVLIAVYYTAYKLLVPLAYALTASPEALRGMVARLFRAEAERVLAGKAWHDKLLATSLYMAASLPEAAIYYAVVSAAVSEATKTHSLPLESIVLLYVSSLIAGYLTSTLLYNLATGRSPGFWARAAITSASLLAALATYTTLAGYMTPRELARTLLAPLESGAPPRTRLDTILQPKLVAYEHTLAAAFRDIEYIARFLAELLWG